MVGFKHRKSFLSFFFLNCTLRCICVPSPSPARDSRELKAPLGSPVRVLALAGPGPPALAAGMTVGRENLAGAVGLEKQRGPRRDPGHCDISLSTFGVSSANGQGWAQDAVLAQVKGDDLQVSPLGVRNNGMRQPRPGGKAENGTGGSSR